MAIRQRSPFLPILFLSDYPVTPPGGLSARIPAPFDGDTLLAAANRLLTLARRTGAPPADR